jgi:glutathione S-transferase
MPIEYLWTSLVTVLTLFMYLFVGINVGRARNKYGVKAPAITGDPAFERVFRAHQNTLEHLVPFLAALWLFTIYVNALWGAIIGGIWILGRIIYALGYYQENNKRFPGFGLSMTAYFVLLLGALYGIVMLIVKN